MHNSAIRLAVAASFASFLACGHAKKVTITPTLTFQAPTDGQSLSLQDDVDAALDGIQVDVKVGAANLAAASVVSLTVADSQVQTAIVDGVAIFPSVTIPYGSTVLTATSGTASAKITVLASPSGAVCAFVAPVDGDQLTAADDKDPATDGFQLDLAIQCNGIASGAQVQVGLEGRRQQTVTLGADGRATLPGFTLAEGANVLAINAAVLAQPVEAHVSVDTGRCQVSIAPADGAAVLFDATVDHVSTTTPARSVVVTTTCAVGSAATLTISGATFDSSATTTQCETAGSHTLTAAVAADGTATFAGAILYQGNDLLSATVVEPSPTQPKSGAALPNLVTVDTVPPLIGFVFPDSGLGTDVVDSDPTMPGAQTTLHGQVIGVEADTQVVVTVTGATGTASYNAPVVLTNPANASCFDQTSAVGTFTIVGVTLDDGQDDILYTITDRAGNQTSRDAQVIISSEAPVLTITSPVSGAVLAGDALAVGGSDVDPATPGLQVDVTIDIADASLTGQPGEVLVSGQGATNFTYTSNPQKVRVTLTDTPSATVTASVTLPSGAVVSSPPITITVRATPPTLVVESPRDGSTFPSGTTAQDINVVVSGAAVVRILNGTTVLASQTVTAAMQEVTFTAVPLAAGANVFTIQAADSATEPANTAQQTLNLYVGSGTATAAWTLINALPPVSPVALAADPQPADSYDVTAHAHITGVPGIATVVVSVSSSVGLGSPVFSFTRYVTIPASGALDITDLTFTLPSGDQATVLGLQVTDAQPGDAPGMASLTVSVPGSVGQVVAITAPSDFERTNATTLPFTLMATSALGAVACGIQVDADTGGASTAVGTLSGGTLSGNVDISGLSDGLHSLVATCAGAISQRQAFELRRGASMLTFVDATGVVLSSISPSYVNAKASDVSAAAGLQIDITVATSLPDGTPITLDVVPATGPAPSDQTVTAFAGRATFTNVTVSNAAAPDGESATITASAADPFSGATDTVSRNTDIDITPPSIASRTGSSLLPGCPTSIQINNANDQPGTKAIEYNLTYATSGGATAITTQITSPLGTSSQQTAISGAITVVNASFPVAAPPASYVATITSSVTDLAQNSAVSVCTPTVDPLAASVSFYTRQHSFSDPNATTTLNTSDDENATTPGLQVTVQIFAQNVGNGAVVHFCSDATTLAASGTKCDFAAGVIIGSGTVQSAGSQLLAALTNVTLIDGSYKVTAEIEDGSTNKHNTSAAFPIVVDTALPPTVTNVAGSHNVTTNDDATAMRIGANVTLSAGVTGSECDNIENPGTPSATCDETLTFAWGTASSVLNGGSATLTSSQGINITQPLSGSPSQVSFTLTALLQGVQTFTLTLTTASGNTTSVTRELIIDLTPPTLVIGAPSADPYLCGSPTGCTGGLSLAVSATASDDHDLGGGCVCLTTSSSCLTATGACPATGTVLTTGTSASVAPTIALPEGSTPLNGQVTDSVGNVGTPSFVTYDVDTLVTIPAPTLAIAGCAGAGTQASPCVLSGSKDGNGRFPVPAKIDVSAPGTSHTPTPSACALTSDSNATCTFAGQLLERRVGDTTFRGVFNGATPASTTPVPSATLLDTLSGGVPALDLASEWELVWDVVDQRGNHERSPSVFVALPAGLTGATLSLEKALDHGAPSQTGTILSNGAAFGARNAYTSPTPAGTYQTDLGLEVDWVGTPTAPACALLQYDGATVITAPVSAGASVLVPLSGADFPASALVAGSSHTLTAEVLTGACPGATPILASTTLLNVTFVNVAPTIVYDATWMTAHGFGPVSGKPGTVVAVSSALDQNPSLAGYQFGTPGNVTTADPPVVDVTNASGGTVTFSNDQSSKPVSGTTTAAITSGTVTASSALSLPSTADAGGHVTTQLLIATACNTAGDCTSTTIGGLGVETSLPLKVDVDAPGTTTPTVCLGETNVPAGVSGPAATEYTDDPACTAACASPRTCSRAQGKVVLAFNTPAQNGALDGPVASYQAIVAIRDVDAPSISECESFLRGLSASALSSLAWPSVTATKTDGTTGIATPGTTQYLQLSNVSLHQRYCFAVLATDFAGNTALIQNTTPAMRVIEWTPVSATAAAPFTRTSSPSDRPDDSAQPTLGNFPGGPPTAIIQVGDMDGDGFPEIAVGDPNANNGDGAVFIFSSRRTRVQNFAPRTTINGPSGSGANIGWSLASGDFNSDGAADLAIGAPFATANGSQGSFASGVTYVYNGAGTPSGQGEAAVVQTALCTFSPLPSIGCPNTVIYGDASDLSIGWSVAGGIVSHSGAGPADLIVGAPGVGSTGAVYVIRGGSAAFPNPAATQSTLIDMSAAAPAYITTITQPTAVTDGPKAVGNEVGIGDFDGDGIGDVFTNAQVDAGGVWAYHFFAGGSGLFSASSAGLTFNLSNSPLGASCLETAQTSLNTVGKIAGGTADWAVYGSASPSFVTGGAGFYASRVCGGGFLQNSTLQAESQFGAKLDPECNTGGLTVATTSAIANAQLDTPFGASPFVDLTGDGRPEFLLSDAGGLPSDRSRVFVISYSKSSCGTTDEPRIVSELTGSPTTAFSLGFVVTSAGTHAGSTPGIITAGLNASGYGVWLFQ